jgi:hypothetical protein
MSNFVIRCINFNHSHCEDTSTACGRVARNQKKAGLAVAASLLAADAAILRTCWSI